MSQAIGKTLREARKNSRMSCADVGERLGVSGATVSAWERGQNDVGGKTLLTLCSLYGIDFDAFDDRDAIESSSGLDELCEIYENLSEAGRLALVACARGLKGSF